MSDFKVKKLAVVGPATRFKVTPGEGGRLVIKGPSVVRGTPCDLGSVMVDGTIEIPKGKRLVIEDDTEIHAGTGGTGAATEEAG